MKSPLIPTKRGLQMTPFDKAQETHEREGYQLFDEIGEEEDMDPGDWYGYDSYEEYLES
jgi:hypothetical protein